MELSQAVDETWISMWMWKASSVHVVLRVKHCVALGVLPGGSLNFVFYVAGLKIVEQDRWTDE
jgi:hypothetical protein